MQKHKKQTNHAKLDKHKAKNIIKGETKLIKEILDKWDNVGVVSNPTGVSTSKGFNASKSYTIKNREYICNFSNVNSDGTWALVALDHDVQHVTTQQLNPGNQFLFPWASTIAKLYEHFEFKTLRFLYKPMVTEYQPVGLGVGKVIMNVDYDAADSPPGSEQEMEDSQPRVDARPTEYMALNLSHREMHNDSDAKYVLVGRQPAFTDIKTYSCGQLFIGTSGQTAKGVLGQLYVEYEIKFTTPILSINRALPPITNSTYLSTQSINTYVNGQNAPTPVEVVWQNQTGYELPLDENGNITLSKGNYKATLGLISDAVSGLPITGICKMQAQLNLNGTQIPGMSAIYRGNDLPGGYLQDLSQSVTSIFSILDPTGVINATLTGIGDSSNSQTPKPFSNLQQLVSLLIEKL
jgi:hypothetical protein